MATHSLGFQESIRVALLKNGKLYGVFSK